MKKISMPVLLLFCSLVIFSCSKSNKDYIGKYDSQFPIDIKALNTQTFSGTIHNGFNTVDLATIKLNLIQNELTNTLTGAGTISMPQIKIGMYGNTYNRTKQNIDLIELNIKNDTLFFLIKSPASNERIDAYLFKEGDQAVFGINKNMCSKRASGPQFIKEDGQYNQYSTNDQLYDKFYVFINEQINHNDSIIKTNTLGENETQMLVNANKYYRELYDKK
jgi:hypothetical protein